MKEILKNLIKSFADTLYDESLTCDLCGREVFHGENFCRDCENDFIRIEEDFCDKCGRSHYKKCAMCESCKDYAVDLARSVYEYGGSSAWLIQKLKYNGARYLAKFVAKDLFRVFVENKFMPDIITFVPMTEKERYLRGYNHSEILAKELAILCGNTVTALLEKVFSTKNQVGLSFAERKKNLKGSFKVIDKKLVKGKRILLVDDVLTTGATSNEIAIVLKKAKAKSVYLLTIASISKYSIKNRKI